MFRFKFSLIAIAVAVVLAIGTQIFRSIYASGYRHAADSAQVAVDSAKDVALTRVRDSLRVALSTGVAASRDSDAAVRLDVQSRNSRVARLHSDPVPTVAVAPAIDTLAGPNLMAVRIAGSADTTSYLVHVAVGNWMIGAQEHILAQDAVLRSDSVLVNVTYPARLAEKNRLLDVAESAIIATDSIAQTRGDERDRLRRRVAELTPSRLDRGVRYVVYALAFIGADRACAEIRGRACLLSPKFTLASR